MKNIKVLTLVPLLVIGGLLTACNKDNKQPINNERPYQEGFVYVDPPLYEPIDLDYGDKQLDKVEIIGIPYTKEIKVADFDNLDVQVRAWYMDNTTHQVPLKMKNIPLDFRHYFGEIGDHSITLTARDIKQTFEFKIVDNPDFKGYKCYFYDRNKKLMDTQTVGYYQNVTYQGQELPQVDEDNDYRYTLTGWDHETRYIHQDMQFLAQYNKLEKRWYAIRQYNRESTALCGIVNSTKTQGSGLAYLGRINRAVAYYGPTYELDGEDIELTIEPGNYTKYIQDMYDTIVSELIEYKVDSDYNMKLYGNPSDIVLHPQFATEFDKNYQYKGGIKAYMNNKEDIELSALDPFENTISNITTSFNYLRPVISKDDKPGYYRAAIVGSFDVYLDVSFNKLGDHIYEVGNFNQFVIAPVRYSFKMADQYSVDGEFGPNFDTKLTVSTRSLFYMADAIDWSNW